jgi:hypothetical protein
MIIIALTGFLFVSSYVIRFTGLYNHLKMKNFTKYTGADWVYNKFRPQPHLPEFEIV